MKNENSTFKMLASLFLEFNHETQLNGSQFNTMQTVCNMLNAVDRDRKLNGGTDYKVATQLDESEDNPFYEVDLPDPPINPQPKKAEPKEDSQEVLAKVKVDNHNVEITDDNTAIINVIDDSNASVIGGRLRFNVGFKTSQILDWAEHTFKVMEYLLFFIKVAVVFCAIAAVIWYLIYHLYDGEL